MYAVNRAYVTGRASARRRRRGRADPSGLGWRIPAVRRSRSPSSGSTREVASDDAGAIATFVGTTRAHSRGREVIRLEYEAYEEMAEAEMERIAGELRARHDVHRRRDPPSRRPGRDRRDERRDRGLGARTGLRRFDACREAIDTLKQTVPLWKKELYVGGEEWIGQGS